MKYIIDTSFWVALFLSDDINHEKAKEIFLEKDILKNDIIMNNFIIEETFTILVYKWTKEIKNNFYHSLAIFTILYSSNSINKYIDFYQNINNKISFADIWVIYDWLTYNCELITFDKQQEKIYKSLINKINKS